MSREHRLKLAVAALCLVTVASLAGNAYLYPKATRPLFEESDRPLIERTTHLAAKALRSSTQEVGRSTFPIVINRADQSCVELRANHGKGHFGACYDRRSGQMVEESAGTTDY